MKNKRAKADKPITTSTSSLVSVKPSDCFDLLKEFFFPTKPQFTKLQFTYPAWTKLQCYINLVGGFEVTGFGRIVDGKIVDVKILKQTIKTAEVDCDIDSMVEFMRSIPKEQLGQWILDWHSHVNMGVFKSGTDTANYKAQWEARLQKQFPIMIVNKKQEVLCENYINPSRQTEIEVSIDEPNLTVEEFESIYRQCEEDVSTLCKKELVIKSDTLTRWQRWYDNDAQSQDYDWSRYYNTGSTWNIPRYNQPPSKQEEKNQLDDFCQSCKTYLTDADEYDRGICDDCWEKMTYTEQIEYLRSRS